MTNLTIFEQNNLIQANLSDSTKNIYLEILTWYRNLTPYTRSTYKDSVTSFCNSINLNSVEELKDIKQLHIIEYRDNLINLDMEKRTINTRISALSSLFNHLIEK